MASGAAAAERSCPRPLAPLPESQRDRPRWAGRQRRGRAAELITFGERQIAIAYDLDDTALQRDLGPTPRTPLVEGVRRTLQHFKRLQAEGRLDTADLDG